MLTLVDLFAGCGGLSLGLEQAGFTPIYVNELNKNAMDTYLINRKDNIFRSNDIKELTQDLSNLGEVYGRLKEKFDFTDLDLVAGGPPCQGYSEMGHRRIYSVDKEVLPSNHLFKDMCMVIKEFRPKIFLFENVRGLLFSKWTSSGDNGEIFRDVLAEFESLDGYRVKWKMVYSKDYGVPQNRPRVLLVGVRNDLNVVGEVDHEKDAVLGGFLPKPTDKPPTIVELLSDLVDPDYVNGSKTLYYPHDAMNKYQSKLREFKDGNGVMCKGDVLEEQEYSNHGDRAIAKFNAMLLNEGVLPEEFKTKKFNLRLLPREWGEKGPTITACSLPEDYVHYCQPRIPTVREWARLQTFPDWYKFTGNRTTGGKRRAGNPREGIFEREVPKYTQIGNAVPVKLAYEVGMHFKSILSK